MNKISVNNSNSVQKSIFLIRVFTSVCIILGSDGFERDCSAELTVALQLGLQLFVEF